MPCIRSAETDFIIMAPSKLLFSTSELYIRFDIYIQLYLTSEQAYILSGIPICDLSILFDSRKEEMRDPPSTLWTRYNSPQHHHHRL